VPDQTVPTRANRGAAAPRPAFDPVATADARPLFFLHIPKTAGTSFLTTLQNLFGDSHVLRLAMEDPTVARRIADVANGRAPGVACLNGHLPADLIAGHLEKLRPFTILRDPIARVFSLFRFVQKNRDHAEFGLPPNFTFEQFLANRDPSIYGQAHNGMCRMLAGTRPFSIPEDQRYTEADRHPELVGRAVALLETIDFGLAEDMAGTHRLIRHRWGVPFDIDEMTLNTTERDDAAQSWANVYAVVERNRLDIALYERARAIFRERLANLDASGTTAAAASMIHRPALGDTTALADIPGRQGFHEWEEHGIAWIAEGPPARVHFLAPAPHLRIRLRVFGMGADYPFDRVRLDLNGKPLPFRVVEPDRAWCTLETQVASARPDLNALSIAAPKFIPVRSVHPNSPDRRNLGLAVAWVRVDC
jgi:hypothetical protein